MFAEVNAKLTDIVEGDMMELFLKSKRAKAKLKYNQKLLKNIKNEEEKKEWLEKIAKLQEKESALRDGLNGAEKKANQNTEVKDAAQLAKEISEKTLKIEEIKGRLEKEQDEVKKKEIEKELETAEDELTELEDQRDELEKKSANENDSPEVKQARIDLDGAKKKAGEAKTALKNAKEALDADPDNVDLKNKFNTAQTNKQTADSDVVAKRKALGEAKNAPVGDPKVAAAQKRVNDADTALQTAKTTLAADPDNVDLKNKFNTAQKEKADADEDLKDAKENESLNKEASEKNQIEKDLEVIQSKLDDPNTPEAEKTQLQSDKITKNGELKGAKEKQARAVRAKWDTKRQKLEGELNKTTDEARKKIIIDRLTIVNDAIRAIDTALGTTTT